MCNKTCAVVSNVFPDLYAFLNAFSWLVGPRGHWTKYHRLSRCYAAPGLPEAWMLGSGFMDSRSTFATTTLEDSHIKLNTSCATRKKKRNILQPLPEIHHWKHHHLLSIDNSGAAPLLTKCPKNSFLENFISPSRPE